MNDVLKVDDILLEIEADFNRGARSNRTNNRMTIEDWESQPYSEDEAED